MVTCGSVTANHHKPSFSHRYDCEILKNDADHEGEDEIQSPGGENLFGKQARIAEGNENRRYCEGKAFGEYVAERAASPAVKRALGHGNGEGCVLGAMMVMMTFTLLLCAGRSPPTIIERQQEWSAEECA